MRGGERSTNIDYRGTYDVVGRCLTRRSDGQRLEIRVSRRSGPGYTPTYLHDATVGRYVSNLYQRPDQVEFEVEGIRYAIIRESRQAVRIAELFRYRKGGSRRQDREPIRRDGQLTLFT